MLYTMLFAGGKAAAQNPNIGFGGSGEHSTLSTLDPIGNWITGIGGDPLNLYGNKNNPGALLFPGPNGTQTGMGPVTGPQTGPNAGLMSAYSNFLRNLGAPPMQGGPGTPSPRPQPRPPLSYGGGGAGGAGFGGPSYRGPQPGDGSGMNGNINAWLASLSQLNAQPTFVNTGQV